MPERTDAVNAFDLARPDTPLAKALVAAGRLTYQSVLDPKLHAQAVAAVDALCKRSDVDPIPWPTCSSFTSCWARTPPRWTC